MGLYYDQIFSHIGVLVLTLLILFAAGFYVFGMEQIYLEQEKGQAVSFTDCGIQNAERAVQPVGTVKT